MAASTKRFIGKAVTCPVQKTEIASLRKWYLQTFDMRVTQAKSRERRFLAAVKLVFGQDCTFIHTQNLLRREQVKNKSFSSSSMSDTTGFCTEAASGSCCRVLAVGVSFLTKQAFRCLIIMAGAACFLGLASTSAGADDSQLPAKEITVKDKFGGQIFGYGVDQNGTEGILSESVLLPDGNLLVATETFDQSTGKIVKVVTKKTETQDDFVAWGVVGKHVGLFEQEHVQGIFVVKRTFDILSPLAGNRVTGKWTPPVDGKTQLLEDVEGNQGTPNVAAMASPYACCGRFVFGSDVAANKFGPVIQINDPILNASVPPVLAFDSKHNRAVLAQAQGAPFTVPEIGLVNLANGKITKFTGLGFGFVNGLAVDSATGIACTTTETDNSAEFYDLATKTGFIVVLPNIGLYSGATVAVDSLHKLFFIAHPIPAALGEIHIYDEKGNLKNSLGGFAIGPGGTTIALNPGKRTGFVQAHGSNGNSSALQSFTY